MSGRSALLWDTTTLSRLTPFGPATAGVLNDAIVGNPVRVAAPAILEVAYGCQLAAKSDIRYLEHLGWLARRIADGTFHVVPFDSHAALIAGRVRGRAPHAAPRKGDRRSKTMRQAAWLLDIQIGATAFATGLGVATSNREDFERIAETLVDLFPTASPLRVDACPIASSAATPPR